MRTKITRSGVALAIVALFAPTAPASAEPADGPGPGRIVFGGRLSAFAGSFSPDGRWIVFRLQNNETGRSGLWMMRTDGSHQHEIFHQDGVRARSSDWG